MEQLGRILMVEDDPRDVELTLTALEDYKLAGCDRAIPTACSDRQRESTLPCEPNVWSGGMGLAGRSSFGEMMENAHFLS